MPKIKSGIIIALVSCLTFMGIINAEQTSPPVNATAPTPGQAYYFDMGSSNSPLFEGFTRVTPETTYSSIVGYGWTNAPDQLRHMESFELYKLGLDSIAGKWSLPTNATVTFWVNAPNGEYLVWILTGAMNNSSVLSSMHYMVLPHELYLQGKPVKRIEPDVAEVYRCANYDWNADDDIYKEFVSARYAWLKQPASVTNGILKITFGNAHAFPVSVIVVAPQGEEKTVTEKLRLFDDERRQVFNKLWVPDNPPPDEPAEATAAEKDCGYIIAETDCEDTLQPWSQPALGDSRESIKSFATPGEQLQLSFAVYGLKDLSGVQYKVTDLKSPEGKIIPASIFECGLVQFYPMIKGSHSPAGGTYTMIEGLILPARPTSVKAGTCKRFWLTLRIPDNTPAGVYSGQVQISAANSLASSLNLQLRVLSFKLTEPVFGRYLYFAHLMEGNFRNFNPEYCTLGFVDQEKQDAFWQAVRQDVRFLKDNEFSLAEIRCIKYQVVVKDDRVVDIENDLRYTRKLMDIIREEDALPKDNIMICVVNSLDSVFGGHWIQPNDLGTGDRKWDILFVPTPEGRAKFIQGVQWINEKARAAGWPEVAFECGGENNNYGLEMGSNYAVAANRTLKQAGVSTAMRGNGKADMAAVYAGVIDYAEPNWAMMKKDWMDYMRKNCKRLWHYNSAHNRFGNGWFCRKQGITRIAAECVYHAPSGGQPRNTFDGSLFPMSCTPISLTAVAPSKSIKRMVEGIFDYKYISTLEQLIRESEKPGNREAVEAGRSAKAFLQKILDILPEEAVPFDATRPPSETGDIIPGSPNFKIRDLDLYRWQVAEHIMAIRKALK